MCHLVTDFSIKLYYFSSAYSASELVDLGGDKFTYALTIDALKEEDVKKNIYFLLKADEERK